jgi:hypothetical protein
MVPRPYIGVDFLPEIFNMYNGTLESILVMIERMTKTFGTVKFFMTIFKTLTDSKCKILKDIFYMMTVLVSRLGKPCTLTNETSLFFQICTTITGVAYSAIKINFGVITLAVFT